VWERVPARAVVWPFDVARKSVEKGSVAALQVCAYSRNPRGSMCQSHALHHPSDDDDVITVVADADCPACGSPVPRRLSFVVVMWADVDECSFEARLTSSILIFIALRSIDRRSSPGLSLLVD